MWQPDKERKRGRGAAERKRRFFRMCGGLSGAASVIGLSLTVAAAAQMAQLQTDEMSLATAGEECTQAAEELLPGKICRESGYAALLQDNLHTQGGDFSLDYFNLYDSEGKYAGQTVYYPAVGFMHGFLEKGGLYTYTLDGVKYLQDTTSLEILEQIPEEEGILEAGKSLYCILRYQEGTLEVYSADQSLLCRFEPYGLQEYIPQIRESVRKYQNPLKCTKAGNAALITCNASSFAAGILLRSDGSILTSNQPDFPNAFLQDGFRKHLGSFFLREYFSEKGTSAYEVYTEEGTLLMKGMQTSYNDSFNDLQIADRFGSDVGVNYIYRPDPESDSYQVFDASLQLAGLYSDTYMRDYNGIIIGFPCEELGGRNADGVAEYCSESKMPWVRTEYGCDIWNGQRLIQVVLPENEYPEQFNDELIYTREEEPVSPDGQKTVVRHLRKITAPPQTSPGEDLADPAWDGPNVWLEKGSFAVMGRSREGEPSCIYDAEGTLLFSTRGRLLEWMDGNYCLLRGAHTGIIDRNGQWLVKEYYAKE